MARIGVWQTIAGAAFITPDAIGFGFYSPDQFDQLKADLEMGLSVNKAAGFSGDVYPLKNLRKIHIYDKRKQVIVQFMDILLGGKVDFNFLTQVACKQFCEVLLENLGPNWKRQMAPRRGWLRILLPPTIIVVSLFFLAISVSLLFKPNDPNLTAEKQAAAPLAGALCGGVSLVFLAGGSFLLWRTIKRPPMLDTIQKA